MTSTLRAVAESRFAAITRRETSAMTEVEAEHRATQEKTARLKALRLATEAQLTADRVSRLKAKRQKPASRAD